MKVLVTGGSGFMGGHIVQACEKRGYSVTILDVHKPAFFTDSEFFQGDITKPLQCSEYFDIVFHAAGSLGTHTTFDRIEETFDTNIKGMISLMNWAKDRPVINNDYKAEQAYELTYPKPRVINCGLIRDWLNPYMISKHTASKIGLMYNDRYGVDFLDIRMTVVYGPRQGWKEEKVVPTFILNALHDRTLRIFGDGSSMMNMMYVKDVANILVNCAIDDSIIKTGMMDLANPDGDISVIDFARKVKTLTNSTSIIHGGNMRPGQPGNVGVRYNLTQLLKVPHSFRTLDEGLEPTISWYRGQS
jgi:nucleoside-diphosphate-sugar epimerase